jgi:hypothetical protein
MEPLNDDELNELLHQWQAPPAPARVDARVLSRWRWLLNGTIRVRVPAGLAAVLILVFSIYLAVSARRTVEKPDRTVTLSDFQPVKQLQPRIIRSGYEGQ